METGNIVFTLITLLAFGVFAFICIRILKLFSLTRKAQRLDKIGQRISIVLKIAFGQSKMMKRPLAGILHAFIFWGFLVILFGTIEMIIDGITGSERILSKLGIIYSAITGFGEIFAALIIISCIVFLIRRYIIKPRRFKGIEMKPTSNLDATFVLFMIFILMVSLLGMNIGYIGTNQNSYAGAYPVSKHLLTFFSGSSAETLHSIETANWWLHICLIYFFLNFLPFSKHFHVFSSVPNVFLSRLEPFAKLDNMQSVTREVKLMLDPSAAASDTSATVERFGVKDAEDTTWKTLLDSYTCTECGRCTAVCPANKTGKRLSPRKLFIDLRRRMKDKGAGLITKGKEYSDNRSLIHDDYISMQEIWACTTCMACIEECPVDIDHVPFIVDLRRNLVMEESKAPSELNMMFTNIENNGAPWQFSPSDRLLWAEGLEIKVK